MFQFFGMRDNYDERKVGRNDYKWGFVSTAEVNDGAQPYETAVKHVEYNDGSMVIVEAYDSREQAEQGHERWVQTMTAETLPESLTDCCNAEIGQFCDALAGDPSRWVYRRQVKE